jgi:hypothetical protein
MWLPIALLAAISLLIGIFAGPLTQWSVSLAASLL